MTQTREAFDSDGNRLNRPAGFREYTATINTDYSRRFAGIGLKLQVIIDEIQDCYRSLLDAGDDAPDDVTVWSGGRLLAVLRARPDARDMEVIRFDREAGTREGV